VATTLTIGTVSGFMAAAILVVAGSRWLRLMRQVRVPEDRRGFVAACAVAAALGGAAFVLETNLAGGIAAGLAVEGGLAFLGFSAASGQPALAPAVAVGGPVLDFVATDDEGRPFDLALLRGQPFLLKFFRGHWCPYCTAELRRWEELRPELDARGIRVVAVCADTAADPRRARQARPPGDHGARPHARRDRSLQPAQPEELRPEARRDHPAAPIHSLHTSSS
jgi:hypothetical protein